MKIIITLLISGFILTSTIAQDTSNPGKYLSSITNEINPLEKEVFQYMRVGAKSKSEKRIEKKRQELISEIKRIKQVMAGFTDYQDDSSLIDMANEFLTIYSSVIAEDFENLVDMEAIKDQSYDDLEAYMMADKAANEKLEDASSKLTDATQMFAEAHDITLNMEQSSIGKKVEAAGEVIEYGNSLNLILARLNFEEGYVIEAMNRNDINGMQQHMNSMKSFVEEESAKLNEIGGFKGDTKLKYAAKKLVDFYDQQVNKELPKAVSFFLLSDEFQLKTEKIESVKPKKRTNEMINEYNDLVNAYNKQLNVFNNINEKSNKNRDEYWNKWKDAREKFMSKHIPR